MENLATWDLLLAVKLYQSSKKFQVKLHEVVTNPNLRIDSKKFFDKAIINITKCFQGALNISTITIPFDKKGSSTIWNIKSLNQKETYKKIMQRTHNSDIKRKLNRQSEIVRNKLPTHSDD